MVNRRDLFGMLGVSPLAFVPKCPVDEAVEYEEPVRIRHACLCDSGEDDALMRGFAMCVEWASANGVLTYPADRVTFVREDEDLGHSYVVGIEVWTRKLPASSPFNRKP